MTARRPDGPPESWLALVRRLVPAHRREEVVGDLIELWRLRTLAGARLRGLRFWRDVWSVARHTDRPSPTSTERTMTMELLLTDMKTALRGLRTSMGTTLLAFVILAVTIAAGTVTFSVVDAVAIRPLPFAAPDELVSAGRLWKTSTTPGPVAPQDYFNWLEHTSSFTAIGASRFGSSLGFDIGGVHGTATTARVTANLFDVLGVKAAQGRLFREGEDEPGRDDVIVLSHTFWTQHFAADPSVIGRRLTADRRFNAGVMAIFGAIAILIGASGIYGTMAFLVAQRVREIGVRMALGASPSRVMRTVIRDASWCVLLGLIVGLAAARAVSSLFTSLVFGVTPTSPSVYVGVASLLVIVGIVAALVPARRAVRLDPLQALRTE